MGNFAAVCQAYFELYRFQLAVGFEKIEFMIKKGQRGSSLIQKLSSIALMSWVFLL
jgi:hypothetical protein